MTKQKQIKEMVDVMTVSNKPFVDIPIEIMPKVAEALYDAGFRKTSTSDIASDTQDAFKEGYIRGNIDGISLARKEAVKEIFTKLIEVAKNNDNKLSIGLLKAWAIEFDVEVEE